MAEPTLPPYLGRTLLEDESDAEEAHQRERVERGSLDSNVEKGEARGQRFLITTLGTWIDLLFQFSTECSGFSVMLHINSPVFSIFLPNASPNC